MDVTGGLTGFNAEWWRGWSLGTMPYLVSRSELADGRKVHECFRGHLLAVRIFWGVAGADSSASLWIPYLQDNAAHMGRKMCYSGL
jgi:hypothetical protein